MSPLKQAFIKLIESLPDDCTEDDIYYHLYFHAKVSMGILSIDEGRVVSQEEAKGRIAEWKPGANC